MTSENFLSAKPDIKPDFDLNRFIVWSCIVLFLVFVFWGTWRAYRIYTPFITNLQLSGDHLDTTISANQYHYSGLIKFSGTANPLRVSLAQSSVYFPNPTIRNGSYTVVIQNTTLIPVQIFYTTSQYTLSNLTSSIVFNGQYSYFVLEANSSRTLNIAYVSASNSLIF